MQKTALAGRLTNAHSAQGLYIFDGKNYRYELNYSVEDLVATTRVIGANQTSSTLSPIRMLCDQSVTLFDHRFLNENKTALGSNPQIYPGAVQFFRNLIFPLRIGDEKPGPSEPHTELNALKAGSVSIKSIDFDSRLAGVVVCKIVLDCRTGERIFWIDSAPRIGAPSGH